MNTDLLTLPVGFLVVLAVLVLITLTLICVCPDRPVPTPGRERYFRQQVDMARVDPLPEPAGPRFVFHGWP